MAYRRGKAYYSDFWQDGRRFRKSWGEVSRSVASEKEATWRRDIRSGKYFQRLRRVSFEHLARKFIDEYAVVNKKPSTVRRYEYSLKALKPRFGSRLIAAITAELAETHKRVRTEDGAAPATVNREIDFLRLVTGKAVEWGYLAFSPLQKVKHLREDNEKMWALTVEQESRLLTECDKRPQRARYLRDLVEFALNTGMRQSEIFGLKKANVRLSKRYAAVTGTKTNENRHVPLNDRALAILRRRMADTPSEYIFCTSRGRKLTVLTNAFWTAIDKAGLVIEGKGEAGEAVKARFRFHDLRHTFGSRLGMQGVDTKTIMEIMGHKTHKMAMRYQHPAPAHKLAAVKMLEKFPPKVTTGKIIKLKSSAKSSA